MEGTRCYIESQIKRNKLTLSPRGTTLKVYTKNDKQKLKNEEFNSKKCNYENTKQRIKT